MFPPTDVFTRPKKTNWSKDSFRGCCFDYLENALKDEPSTATLLDIGCGNNDFEKITSRFRYTGVDFFPYKPVSVVSDLGKPLPFESKSFDIVFANSTLEHIPNPWDTIDEVYRVLKSGGKFVGGIPFLVKEHQEPYDFVRFTEYGLKSVLSRAGFVDIDVTPMGPPLHTYESIQRFFFRELHHSPLGWEWWRVARIVERVIMWQMRVLRPLYKKAQRSGVLAEGFGFSAKRI